MYAITYHGSTDQLILGPIAWKPRYIQEMINDEFELDVKLSNSDEQIIPFNITPDIRVRKVLEIKPIINPLIEQYDGPFWSYTDDLATANYVPSFKNVDYVREQVKEVLKQKRYEKECAGTKVAIQNQEVTVETDRDTRNIFVQAFLIIGDNETRNWKFKEGWLNLTKTDLQTIVTAGAAYIQSQFDWESSLIEQINISDLNQLVTIYDELTFVPSREDNEL